MDASLIDDHLEMAQRSFRSILCHCKNMDGDRIRRKLLRHNTEMLNIACDMFPRGPTPSSSPHDRRSRAPSRESQYAPSASSSRSPSRSTSPTSSSRTRKRKQDDTSPRKRKLVSRREFRGEAVPAQTTAEPAEKPNGGRARSFQANPIIKPNIFSKVNGKLPRTTKPVANIPATKQAAIVDLTWLEDTDDEFAIGEGELASKEVRGTTVGKIGKNFLDLQRAMEASLESHRSEEDGLDFQRAVQESLFVERDCNGLTRAEKEKLRMSDGRKEDGFGGPMKEVRDVDDEILAGFEAGRAGEWSDDEMERDIMYDEEDGIGVVHEEEEEGEETINEDEGEIRGDGERPPKRTRSL